MCLLGSRSRRCFTISENQVNWRESERECQQNGGKLAIADTTDIQDLFKGWLRHQDQAVWLGGHTQPLYWYQMYTNKGIMFD